MFAIMSFQRVHRLRCLKLLWLESSWIQRKVPPLTPFCTKASNAKKPVRYTSIKKAKPKTISDIAKILQQKTKETKEREQSVITGATSATKPTSPNQFNDQRDVKATIISNAEVQTSTFDFSGSATPVDAESVQDIVDVEVISLTGSSPNGAFKLPVAESTSSCESKDVGQMSIEGLDNKTCAKISVAQDSAPKSVDSGTELTNFNAPQEALTHGDVTANISRVAQTSEAISSYDDVYSTSEKCTPVSSDETVYMSDVTVAFEVQATPVVSSAHQNGHQEESFSVAQAQYYSQPQSSVFTAPNWSSNVNADKPSFGQEITNQAVGSFSDGTTDSILDIFNPEAVTVVSSEAPTRFEEAILFSEPVPEVCSFKSTEDLSVSETIFAVKVDGVSEMSGESQSSINLKDPILAQTDVLEEEKQTEAVEKLPEAQLDPIKRLFLDKIREYSRKSQDSAGLVDAGPEYEKTFREELTKLQRLYGGGDLTKFPDFNFSEPVLDESSSK